MKNPFYIVAAALLAGALVLPSARAADADVTGLVPTIWWDFETKPSASGLATANKGSASISFTGEGTATYQTGVTNGWAVDTSKFTPYSGAGSFSTAGNPFTLSLVMTLGTKTNGITLNLRTTAGDLILRRGADAGSLVVGWGAQKEASSQFLNATFADGDSAYHLVTVVGSPAGTELYVDGELADSSSAFTPWSASGKATQMQFGSHLNGTKTGEAKNGGLVDDLRIHDAALTAAQIKAIAQEYKLVPMTDALKVTGVPEDFGTVVPGYGITNGLAQSAVVACSARGSESATAKTIPIGYGLYSVAADGTETLVEERAAASFTYTHGTTGAHLVWRWACSNYVEVVSAGGGTVSSGGWVEQGGSFSATATPAAGYRFGHWECSAAVGDSTSPSVVIPSVSEPTTLTAVFVYCRLDDSLFTKRIPITVSGYAGTSVLADFPVLVKLDSGSPVGFDYDDCAEDGADLRFADEGGTTLFHEIETWDPDGTSYVWVKVPSLSGMSTVLNLFYGADTNTLSAVDPTGVWTRYAAVFHGGAAIVDATGHAPAVTPNGATTATIGGMAGGVMTKGSATGVTFSNPITSRALSSIDRFSFSGWFKKSGGTSAVLASNKGKDEWAKNGFVALVEGGNYFSVGVGVNNAGAHQPSTDTGKGKLENGKWGHLAFSYDKSTTSISSYFNGAGIFSTTSARNILDPGKSVWAFGGFFDGNKNCFQGDMDEIRILNGTASADWIQAEYDSVADPAAFAVLGAAVPVNLGTPRISAPVVERRTDGSFLVTAEISQNEPVAGSVACVVGGTSFPMTTSDASLPATYSAIVSGVPAGTYVATVQAQAAGGTVVSRTAATPFHAGALVVTGVADADEAALSPGMFRIARADADPEGLPAISFDVAFSGPGLAAVVAPTVATLTIPAGEASVDVTVTPVYTTAVDADATLALSVSGAFVGTPSSGSITIVNATYDPAVRYVATTGDDANHGGTPESPKKTIAAAVDSLASISQTIPCTVHVAPGLYPISKPIAVTNAIAVLGDDPDPSRVLVSNTVGAGYYNQDQRIFRIDHAGAVVANLTMQAGQDYGHGGNLHIGSAGGMVSNCVVEAGYTRDNGKAGGAWLDAGVVTHTVFRKNNTNSGSVWWNSAPSEGVLHLGGSSRAENCLFDNNPQSVTVTLVGVRDSAVLRNCTIVNAGLSATNSDYSVWSALKIDSGATVQNVVIAGVTNTVDGAACPPTGTVANFLNSAFDGDATGLPAGTVTGTAAAFFPHYAKNVPYAIKYQPKAGGPLYDKGADYAPMAAFDLSGTQKRKIASHIDIGCYEANGAATLILIK